ncbi:DsbA family protein [Psychromicrobium sp. YIM B11713]|uniref:DsbA family protein n=1 Tax=Psychromicrobium sp. YIM B11713 TaxID=3145233 RepID=UPI00374F409B
MPKLSVVPTVLALLLAVSLSSCSASSDSGTSPSGFSITASASPSAGLMAKLIPADVRVLNEPAQAKTTLVLFTDYQCPYCAKMDTQIQRLKTEYRDQLRIVVRNLPLTKHQNAQFAAQAVEAAAEQGALEKLASLVFSKQAEWAQASSGLEQRFTGYAQQIGLDITKFNSDLNSSKIKSRVARDLQDATDLGLRGTPSLVLDGKLLSVDSTDYQTVKGPVDRVLSGR